MKAKDVWVCPSMQDIKLNNAGGTDFDPNGQPYFDSAYSQNNTFGGVTWKLSYSPNGHLHPAWGASNNPTVFFGGPNCQPQVATQSMLQEPAKTISLLDGRNGLMVRWTGANCAATSGQVAFSVCMSASRHNSGWNIMLADGHVKFQPALADTTNSLCARGNPRGASVAVLLDSTKFIWDPAQNR